MPGLNVYGGEFTQNLIVDPDSKVPGSYMGPAWGRQDPGGRHVGPMILAIWGVSLLPDREMSYLKPYILYQEVLATDYTSLLSVWNDLPTNYPLP